MSSYQVLFNGAVAEGEDENSVAGAVARELGIEPRKCRQLFSGKTVVLGSQLSERDALTLQERLYGLGALARIKDLAPKAPTQPVDYENERADHTLRDLTAAHVACLRCGHMQLETSHCGRCGVDMEAMVRKRAKEDLLIEKKLRDLREGQAQVADDRRAITASRDASLASQPVKAGRLRRWFGRTD